MGKYHGMGQPARGLRGECLWAALPQPLHNSYPAIKCSCCYPDISHRLTLLNTLSPNLIVLFSPFFFWASANAHASVCGYVCRTVCSGGWRHTVPCLVHPLPSRSTVMICTTACQTHREQQYLHFGVHAHFFAMVFVTSKNHRQVISYRIRTANSS